MDWKPGKVCERDMIKFLDYTQGWFDLGIVDEEYVRSQFKEFQASEDKDQEHYRYRAYIKFFKRKRSLTDDEIDKIFSLKDDDPDQCDMKGVWIGELIRNPILTDKQYFAIEEKYPEIRGGFLKKVYQRHGIFRRLKKEGLTQEVFKEICESEDSQVHPAIFDQHDLKREHVEWMCRNGVNKRVRNIAKQFLNRRCFRKAN